MSTGRLVTPGTAVPQVAIRFSNALQKDTVFTGLKDVIQAIGEACHSRTTVKLEFGDVGTLVVKDSKALFQFESEWEPFAPEHNHWELSGRDEEVDLELLPGSHAVGLDQPYEEAHPLSNQALEVTGAARSSPKVPQLALGELEANRVTKKAARAKTGRSGVRPKKGGAFSKLDLKKENMFQQELPQRGHPTHADPPLQLQQR